MRPEWATAPGVLKILFAKNFSIPAKFGIINLRFKNPLSIFASSMTGKKIMTKRKATAAGLSKISGQDCKPSAALPAGYASLLADLKSRVRAAQLRAAISVNRELILLYWDIGKIIVESQKTKGYGKQVVERLAEDLQKEFPGTAGFSPQNVWFMRSFYLAWPATPEKLPQVVRESKTAILSQPVRESATSAPPAPISELPWGHNRLLLTKLDTPAIRLWYAHKAIEHGWSRAHSPYNTGMLPDSAKPPR